MLISLGGNQASTRPVVYRPSANLIYGSSLDKVISVAGPLFMAGGLATSRVSAPSFDVKQTTFAIDGLILTRTETRSLPRASSTAVYKGLHSTTVVHACLTCLNTPVCVCYHPDPMDPSARLQRLDYRSGLCRPNIEHRVSVFRLRIDLVRCSDRL